MKNFEKIVHDMLCYSQGGIYTELDPFTLIEYAPRVAASSIDCMRAVSLIVTSAPDSEWRTLPIEACTLRSAKYGWQLLQHIKKIKEQQLTCVPFDWVGQGPQRLVNLIFVKSGTQLNMQITIAYAEVGFELPILYAWALTELEHLGEILLLTPWRVMLSVFTSEVKHDRKSIFSSS